MAHLDYALIKNGEVVNLIVIDDQDTDTLAHFATLFEAVVPLIAGVDGVTFDPTAGRQGGPGIGSRYNTAAKRFMPPVQPQVPVDAPGL